MNSWRLVAGFLGMGIVAAACSVKTTSTDDDTSTVGVGGSTTATTTTAGPTTTTTGPTSATTSTSSGVSCDTGAMATIDSMECDACIGCAVQGACSEQLAAFQGDPNSGPWADCVFGPQDMSAPGCPDDKAETADVDEFEVCLKACGDMNPGVEDKYLAVLGCAICGECQNNCDAAANCTQQ